MQLFPSGPAVAAALGLMAIQVGIGIIMKMAQAGGSYSFSTSGSVSISEFCKLLLSAAFFRRECLKRIADGIRPRSDPIPANAMQPFNKATGASENDDVELAQGSIPLLFEEGEGRDARKSHDEGKSHADADVNRILDAHTFWEYFKGELTQEKMIGFYILALAYTLINNSIFLSYHLADPGTIQLVKTSGTLVTAIIMVTTLKTSISNTQWAAVFIQMFGLILTQYKPGSGSAYPTSTYAILVFQVFLSSSSSVYNQHLLKLNANSLHADNMVLYACGAAVNLVCHLIIFVTTPNEPGFFQGYGDIRAILVILSNIFIGLAITSVYKYADAVVKCFATAAATGILLYLSPIIFGAELGSFVMIGTLIVFIASWLYITSPPQRTPHRVPTTATTSSNHHSLRYSHAILAPLTLATVGSVVFMTFLLGRAPTQASPTNKPSAAQEQRVTTPFHDVLAMVRWNSAYLERIPNIRKYDPFFDTVHISIPDKDASTEPAHSWSEDNYADTFTIYHQVSRMMQMVLTSKPDIKGLMYYHFDSWLDPFGFNDTDWNNMWFSYSSPAYTCMKSPNDYDWWGWKEKTPLQLAAMEANRAVERLGLGYQLDPEEWCLAWSDIYYIPRRFFSDYILLAEEFKRFNVFHEVAIPTIAHIIKQTEQKRSNTTALDFVKDCWGSCCHTVKDVKDVLSTRCGHRLDYLNEPVVDAYYKKLDAQAAMLRA
ncbi:hypothetical protein CDD82_1283 [Ophiocordyceps australis]|uniref:UDP-galactose transporter n=1 Tax=Ophiocordyceps australis TaxID=1399860 RepID=A0A2C5ZMV4_9HYPO|nr:hypothetical protein CDD82_1283 [Ophiocordyceps australis]